MRQARNCVLGCAVLLLSSPGCSDRSETEPVAAKQVVYVDLETQQPVVAEASNEAPAVHPETGRRTLMPGLYCAQCERWYPSPPVEELQRNPDARKCRTCGSPLSADGPVPATP